LTIAEREQAEFEEKNIFRNGRGERVVRVPSLWMATCSSCFLRNFAMSPYDAHVCHRCKAPLPKPGEWGRIEVVAFVPEETFLPGRAGAKVEVIHSPTEIGGPQGG